MISSNYAKMNYKNCPAARRSRPDAVGLEPHLLSVGDEPVRDLEGFDQPAMSRSLAVEHEARAFMAALDDVAANSNDTSGDADLSRANAIPKPAYAAAISLVALIGSLSTLHSALKFSSRGLQ
jgi:hypothetical protein